MMYLLPDRYTLCARGFACSSPQLKVTEKNYIEVLESEGNLRIYEVRKVLGFKCLCTTQDVLCFDRKPPWVCSLWVAFPSSPLNLTIKIAKDL